MSVAVVPVKRLEAAKSRLFGQLAQPEREALSLAMLRDVLAALRATPSLDRAVVTTPDPAVAAAARAAGAEALLRDDPGLNAALTAAAEIVAGPGEPVLVVLGDVAGADPTDLEALFTALSTQGARGAVLAPSNDGGTSALLRAPHDAIPCAFGPDSAKAHREAAAQRGVAFTEIALPSLAIDLDLPEDVERFLATGSGGRETRATLRTLGWK